MAASADEQEALLRRLGTAPCADELALVFSDALHVVVHQLPEPVRRSALELDRYLDAISGNENAELWTVEALHREPAWVRVRQLATRALVLLGEDDGAPPPRGLPVLPVATMITRARRRQP